MAATLNTDQHYENVTLSITDSRGRAAAVEGAPVWASSDETVLTVAAAADGMSASIETVAPGTARVTVSADADLGAGVTEEIEVTLAPAGAASVITLTLPAATEKP